MQFDGMLLLCVVCIATVLLAACLPHDDKTRTR